MTSNRPYLIRAVYDWIVDSGLTPYVLVQADAEGVSVPPPYSEGGRLVLDLSTKAVKALRLGNDALELDARFSGVIRHVYIPCHAVIALYAHENGRGLEFPPDEMFLQEVAPAPSEASSIGRPPRVPSTSPPPPPPPGVRRRPHLRVVKNDGPDEEEGQ